MNEQEQLILAFMLDLGIVLGAKDEQEALQTGQAAVLKLGENASKLFQAWGQAESQLRGSGKLVIAEALGGGKQQGAPAQSQPQAIGSMRPEYNAAPTSTAYAKMGTKFLQLNGHCPEGYEVERFLAGGCVKCRKKRALSLAEEMKCGGKKRISKKEIGGNFINEAVLNELRKRQIEQANKSALDRMNRYPVDKLSINDILANPLLSVDTLLPDNYESLMSSDTNLLRSRALEQEKKQKAILEALLDAANKRNLNNFMSSVSFLKCGGKAKKRITKALDGVSNIKTVSNRCGGKTKKKESGGTLNTEWLNLAKQTNKTMSTLNRFTKLGNGKK